MSSSGGKSNSKKNKNHRQLQQQQQQQSKYSSKPTQQIYRPPSARLDSSTSSTSTQRSSSFISSQYHLHHHPNDVFLIKQQPTTSSSSSSTVFNPIRGVLKRSKSFGTSNKNFEQTNKYHYLDDTTVGTFFLSLENVSRDNIHLIKQALNMEQCQSITMNQLLQIIRILCNKVLEKPSNAQVVAKVCLEIHHNQHINMIKLSDHKYLFLESLANCLREWFNERDKLRFTTGGARRWTAYIMFLMEIYVNLKETISKDLEVYNSNNKYYLSDDSNDDPCPTGVIGVLNLDDDDDSEDDEAEDNNNNTTGNESNDSSQADSSSCKSSITSEHHQNRKSCSMKKTSSTTSIELKIMSSLLSKQQKQYSNLILDSFQIILSNPNSTPTEIECMQTVFRRCGKYLEDDNPNRIKSMIFIIRDILLNYSNANQWINANINNNHYGQTSSISKNLLEIIELHSSDWNFNQSQQIYYFPYTRIID